MLEKLFDSIQLVLSCQACPGSRGPTTRHWFLTQTHLLTVPVDRWMKFGRWEFETLSAGAGIFPRADSLLARLEGMFKVGLIGHMKTFIK